MEPRTQSAGSQDARVSPDGSSTHDQRGPIRILLVDDHTFTRAGTRRILEDEPDLRVVGEAGNGHEAIACARETHPDVILLDIAMPQLDGIAASPELRRAAPEARLLILTGYDRRAYVAAFQKLGASGYLLKSADPSELIAAIRRVHAGAYVYDPLLIDRLGANVSTAASPTLREIEVIREVAHGRTNREIAESLGVSEHTVDFHLRNAYSKLGVTTRADAIHIALSRGWLDNTGPLC